MPRLFIAEKPSLARAVASALPGPTRNDQGFIRCGNGDVVTWCLGHLLEQVDPEAYDPKYKRWVLSDLPILPEQWKLKPRSASSKQLTVIRKLLKEFDEIIHTGDPDREGQLLVDEVIDYCKVSKAKRDRVQRLLISDLNPPAVKKALEKMQSNRNFMPLSVSALARSRADWLYGINMTRGYTLLGQKAGYKGVLSVGRVQSPVLGLVVRRDAEIKYFVSRDYYTLDALIPYNEQNEEIHARWQPSDACAPWMDDEGRIIHRKLVENVAARITGQPAEVKQSTQKSVRQPSPLPYSLSALQIDASKRFGLSAQQVLDCCQSLYEKHKLITYPRSDSRHLPNDHYNDSQQVVNSIRLNAPEMEDAVTGADLSIKSKAWNDAKVDAHHAIIPTPKRQKIDALTPDERRIYLQIARQYLMQFYPDAVSSDSKLVFDIAGGEFIAKGRVLIKAGWKALMGKEVNEEDGPPEAAVPALPESSVLTCREGLISDRKTEPPKHFTEATLLQAMTGIARFVSDQSLKKILRETDGLGTEATRAGIIETLMTRKLLNRSGKTIRSTAAGQGLIEALPEEATYPDMTAHWEYQLREMTERQQAYQPFMDALRQQVISLMEQIQTGGVPETLRNLPAVEPVKSKRRKRVTKPRQKRAKASTSKG